MWGVLGGLRTKSFIIQKGNCDIFATIYFRKTDRERQSQKYFVSVTRGAPFIWLGLLAHST